MNQTDTDNKKDLNEELSFESVVIYDLMVDESKQRSQTTNESTQMQTNKKEQRSQTINRVQTEQRSQTMNREQTSNRDSWWDDCFDGMFWYWYFSSDDGSRNSDDLHGGCSCINCNECDCNCLNNCVDSCCYGLSNVLDNCVYCSESCCHCFCECVGSLDCDDD